MPDIHVGNLPVATSGISHDRIGVLYLDVEGGWGGSSRSLYYLVEALDRTRYCPFVVLRKAGPVEAHYKAIGVDCMVMPDMPSFRPGDRKNAIAFLLFVWKLRWLGTLAKRLAPRIAGLNIELVHVNHESLAITGALLAHRFGLPWVGHVRTLLTPGWFARRVYRLMARAAAHVFFITEPNRIHFRALAGTQFCESRTSVVHNIIPLDSRTHAPLPELLDPPGRFRVLSLTNFSASRGVDRIIDVAAALQARGDSRFAFYLCGRPALAKAFSGLADPYYDTIVASVRERGLDDIVFFPGHVIEPERALAASDALIKLTRQANPWGRDIIEALAAGVPVVTLGTFQDFVEDGINGFIDITFDAARIADHLVALANTPDLRNRIRKANRKKAGMLFDGSARARDVEAVYGTVLRARVAGPAA